MRWIPYALLAVGAWASHHVPLTAVRRKNLTVRVLPPVPLPLQGAAAQTLRLAEFRDTLRDLSGTSYTVQAVVGAESTRVSLLIDTGSSDLWIDGKDMARSSTRVTFRNTAVDLKYGKGEVHGYMASDRVCIGELCISEQKFVLATNIQDIDLPDFDGLLGVGFPMLAQGETTFLEQLQDSGQFNSLSFGLSLGGMKDYSFVNFGERDELQQEAQAIFSSYGVTLPLIYQPILYGLGAVPMYWMVGGDLSVGSFKLPDRKLILDSGSSLLVVPDPYFHQIIDHLLPWNASCESGYGVLLCPCDVNIQPLVVNFTDSGGKSLTVTLDYEQLFEKFQEQGFEICRLGMMLGSAEMPSIILGDVFLREVYALHHYTHPSVTLFSRQGFRVEVSPQSDYYWLTVAVSMVLLLFVTIVLVYVIRRGMRAAGRTMPTDGVGHYSPL